jgi:hypothetical protein
LGAMVLAGTFSCLLPSYAITAIPVIPSAGVQRNVTPFTSETTVFGSTEPGFSNVNMGQFAAPGGNTPVNVPFLTMTVPKNSTVQAGGGCMCGWNFPALHQGLLPSTGDMLTITGMYSTSTASNADSGIRVVVQTGDGLYHVGNPATTSAPPSGFSPNPNNGRHLWQYQIFVFQSAQPYFVPALSTTNTGGQAINKFAWGFWGNSNVQSINQVIPMCSQNNQDDRTVISGDQDINQINPGPSGGATTVCTFSINTNPDRQFNFELSGPNN